MKGDGLDEYRKEYNDMLLSKISGTNNSIYQERYLTVSVHKKNIDEARTYFARVGTDIITHLAKLSSIGEELDAEQRLQIFRDFFKADVPQSFPFDMKAFAKKGHSFKDWICPDTMEFHNDHFKLGEQYGRVLFMEDYASYVKDEMISELCSLGRNLMLSIDIIPVPTDEAVREIQNRLLGVETNVTNWQRRQNANNNFSAVVPYDMELQRKETKEMLDDLTTRDQRMMFGILTMVHMAESKKQLDSDTETLYSIARKHLCQMATLKWQQVDGLNTVLPYGLRKIDAVRTLTTESTAVLIPFHTQEIMLSLIHIYYTEYTIKSMLVCTLLYAAGIGIFYSSQKNYRRGEEHGSARWGDARQICKKYSQKPYSQNILLTQNFRISLDTHKHRRCLNILVVGGSGAGKSRGFALPNIMQCCCSMVITDPKAELLRKTGGLLEKKGYEVRVFDLINPDTSFCYNPFEYVHDDKDVLRLISNLIQNTTPKGSQSSDPFWEKSETALLQALMLYLLHEAPPEEQNFAMIMEMLGSAQVKEEDEDYESPLDILFDRLEMRDPDSIAVKQYHIYKQAAGKTAKSILISVGVRLAAFNLPQIAKLTNTDELDLSSMGEKKVALFCCIPDADTSLNYLVGMIYSQLFQTLYYMADRVHGGALPVPVNCIMDEFPNVSLPNEFEKILATCRSRSIYCSIIIQNMSQLKALFKDSWESLVGNCDEFLYLGGNEKETHKYVSELLGKETIDTNTYGQTKGKSGSYSTNFQQSGRELLQPDEVRMLDNQNALLFIRGERPILDAKYDLMKHPNIRYTEDGGAGPFNYAKAPLAHDDFTFDETRYNDYELLLDEDIIGELF